MLGIGSIELKRKFHAAVSDRQINDSIVPVTSAMYIQSATDENSTKAAQIADRWIGYFEDLYHYEEGKGIEQEYWSKSLHHFV